MMKHNTTEAKQRLSELLKPVDMQIMMCDDGDDVLLMACGMMQRIGEIFENQLGKAGAEAMFKDMIDGRYRSGHDE